MEERRDAPASQTTRRPRALTASPTVPTPPPARRVTHTWIGVLGVLVFVASGLMVIGSIGEAIANNDPTTNQATYIGLAVFFVLLAACGVWMVIDNFGLLRRPKQAGIEQRILALAEVRDGRLTVDEVAAHTGLSIVESKTGLDRLVSLNAAQLEVTDKGLLLYIFPGFLSAEEKRTAKLV